MSIIQSMYENDHEYRINGATYIVSAAFKHTGRITPLFRPALRKY